MAKIGLNSFRYAVLTEASDGTPSYDGAKTPAKAISCSVSITNNDVSLYADDAVAESDTSFQTGTVSIGIDDEDQTTMATLLGHTVESGGNMVRNSNLHRKTTPKVRHLSLVQPHLKERLQHLPMVIGQIQRHLIPNQMHSHTLKDLWHRHQQQNIQSLIMQMVEQEQLTLYR